MTNQYNSKCCICGDMVEAGSGVCDKVRASQAAVWPIWSASNKWVIRHVDCPAPVKETDFLEIKNDPRYEKRLDDAARYLADRMAEAEKYFG